MPPAVVDREPDGIRANVNDAVFHAFPPLSLSSGILCPGRFNSSIKAV